MTYIFQRLWSQQPIQVLIGSSIHKCNHQQSTLTAVFLPNLQTGRYKSKKSKIPERQSDTESGKESGSDVFDYAKDKHSKVLNLNLPSMRVDTILKAGLGLSRNKIEVIFYESKIRVNGEKIPKKSVSVQQGDEIDIIKGTSLTNPDFLIVARVEVLSAKGEEDGINVKVKRCKSLIIENYEGRNKWTQSQES